jgi:hypothetical protein
VGARQGLLRVAARGRRGLRVDLPHRVRSHRRVRARRGDDGRGAAPPLRLSPGRPRARALRRRAHEQLHEAQGPRVLRAGGRVRR